MNPTERERELAAVDEALKALPPIEPPPEVVARTIAAVDAARARAGRGRRLGAMLLAFAAVLLSVGVAWLAGRRSGGMHDASNLGPIAAVEQKGRALETPEEGDDAPHPEVVARVPRSTSESAPSGEPTTLDFESSGANGEGKLVNKLDDTRHSLAQGYLDLPGGAEGGGDIDGDGPGQPSGPSGDGRGQPSGPSGDGWFWNDQGVTRGANDRGRDGFDGLDDPAVATADKNAEVLRAQDEATLAVRGHGYRASGKDEWKAQATEPRDTVLSDDMTITKRGSLSPSFIPARGYFANTYIPGDKDIAAADLGPFSSVCKAAEVQQPFDRPVGQAMALYLSADHTAVTGPTRMTLQVGLAGAEAAKSRRAPLALALVVDVASAQDEAERRALWTMAETALAERQPGDVLHIVIPGAVGLAGPKVLSGPTLDAATVTRALAEAVEVRPALTIDALRTAYQNVTAQEVNAFTNEARAVLGASVVVLATAGPLAPELAQAIENEARIHARSEIQLSVIGAGSRVAPPALGVLTQAGQGRRWLATSPDDARRAVEDELAAAGRMVARVLRLRVALAPGVKLVEVIGSHPLSNAVAARTIEEREAMQRRLSESRGIEDLGEPDGDGILIDIPAFMAGDDHAVLLDVVVPGPGPVMDVQLRWKDLLRMTNGEAQASLVLPHGPDQATPLARNVLQNKAAMIASDALMAAARDVSRGDFAQAGPRLSIAKARLVELGQSTRAAGDEVELVDRCQAILEAPGWMNDEATRAEMVRALENTGLMLR